MSDVRPFRALRPPRELVEKLAAPPYDVLNTEEARAMADIPANLVRLCVGGEHPDDIIADIEQALA